MHCSLCIEACWNNRQWHTHLPQPNVCQPEREHPTLRAENGWHYQPFLHRRDHPLLQPNRGMGFPQLPAPAGCCWPLWSWNASNASSGLHLWNQQFQRKHKAHWFPACLGWSKYTQHTSWQRACLCQDKSTQMGRVYPCWCCTPWKIPHCRVPAQAACLAFQQCRRRVCGPHVACYNICRLWNEKNNV